MRSSPTVQVILLFGQVSFEIWEKSTTFSATKRGYGLWHSCGGCRQGAAAPDRFVLCFAGDGDFQMNGNELGTAMQSGLQPVILVINNGSYGAIRMHQEREYPARVSGTELVNPDFVTLAKAYGFYGERVENTADFAGAFERARESKTGALLELVLATEAITPRQTIGDLRALSQ